MPRLTATIVTAAAGALLLSAQAHAAVFTADADTYIDSANATTNYGTDAQLRVITADDVNPSPATSETTFVRFDISGFTGPVTAADFTIQKLSGRGDRTVDFYGITDETFDSFDESSLTWANTPINPNPSGNDGTSLTAETLLGVLSSTTPTRVDGIDVYGYVDNDADTDDELLNFINADTNGIVTFALHQSQVNGNQFVFASSENTGVGLIDPTLTLIPEPASLALLACGSLCLLTRKSASGVLPRRRR
jgi:hypothetical protein